MQIAWPKATDVVELRLDTLDIWGVWLEDERARTHELLAMLSDAERQRVEEFRLDAARRRFALTRATLRVLLGRYLGTNARDVELVSDRFGKPRLADDGRTRGVRFNVAHSGNFATIAVAAGCEVGIDVERIREISQAEQIARRYFHPDEAQAIAAADPAARDVVFLRYWTAKEAIVKAIGTGVGGSLAWFRVPTPDEFQQSRIDLPETLPADYSRCWLRALTPCDGYVGAVASVRDMRTMRHFAIELSDMSRQ